MWLMLQQEEPEDFVIATGEMHSVREFVEASFKYIGKTIKWQGEGNDEVGIEEETNTVRVKVNPKYYRPTEVVSTSLSVLLSINSSGYSTLFICHSGSSSWGLDQSSQGA